MQKLKSFGCSFTWGSELNDVQDFPDGTRPPVASNLTWPALLAKHHQLEYECYARAGSGNLRILDSLMRNINEENALYVVNWSWIDRFDYHTEEKLFFANSHRKIFVPGDEWNNRWKTILPSNETAVDSFYYKNLHSQYRDKLVTLTYITAAIDLLKRKKIKFIMTAIDDLVFETEWHTSPAIENLQQSIKEYITYFDNLNFLDWSRKNNYPISAAWHPLEAAHQAAAEYIKNLNLV